MKVRRSMLKDTVQLETRAGDGAYGPVYDEPITVRCNIDETRRLVRDANGDEAVAEATLTLHPTTQVLDEDGQVDHTVDPLEVFLPESTVTIRTRQAQVLAVKPNTLRGRTASIEVTCG